MRLKHVSSIRLHFGKVFLKLFMIYPRRSFSLINIFPFSFYFCDVLSIHVVLFIVLTCSAVPKKVTRRNQTFQCGCECKKNLEEVNQMYNCLWGLLAHVIVCM